MIADTIEELHVMADRIGLKREWFQEASYPHYDLTSGRRRVAVKSGARPVNRHELIEILRARYPRTQCQD